MSWLEIAGATTLTMLAAAFIIGILIFVCETCGLFKRIKDLERRQDNSVSFDTLKWRDDAHNHLRERVNTLTGDQERLLAVVEALTNQQRSKAKK